MGRFADEIRQAVQEATEGWESWKENRRLICEVMEADLCEDCDGNGFHLCDKVVQEAYLLAPAIVVRGSDPCKSCDGKGYREHSSTDS